MRAFTPPPPPPAPLAAARWLLEHGQPEAAGEACAKLLKAQPRNAEAARLLGLIKAGQGRLDEAAHWLGRAAALRPGDAELHYAIGNLAARSGRHDAAAESFERALALRPDLVEAHNNLGVALRALGRFAPAAASFAKALALKPKEAMLHYNLGNALASLDRPQEAIECYRQALALEPKHAGAALNLGAALARLGRHDAALESFRQAQALAPGLAETANNIGNALTELARYDEAVASFEEALALRPDYAEACRNLGRALIKQDRAEAALAGLARALALEPNHAGAHHDQGIALAALGRFEAAAASFAQAAARDGGRAATHLELGNALARLCRFDAAIDSYEQALALDPACADAHNGIGMALTAANDPAAAIRCFERVLAIAPDHADALNNLGNALTMLRLYEPALASYERALAAKPELANAAVMAVLTKRQLCDWREIEAVEARLVDRVRDGLAAAPFPLLAIADDPALHLAAARRHWARLAAAVPKSAPPSPPAHQRLRLGYLSADFHEHATAYLTAGLFESHDRRHFEVFGFSHGIDDGSAMRQRLGKAFDGFFDVGAESDEAVARRIRELEIDILIDLKGHTTDNRLPILARRPAPIQVHYLGYPGTLGSDTVDYLLVDRFIVPADQQGFFSENLVHLPGCYQVNDRRRAAAAETPRRVDCGLPETGFVFCSFNNSYKITPPVFALWMRLLQRVPESVLWLLADNPGAAANLRREAEALGVAAERLIFADRRPLAEHLARHRLADLFLDTLPYTAHTSASDALWMGLPLVSCAGRSFAARVAGSLLHAVGLSELVVSDLAAYEALALRLARDPARLGEIRRKLALARDAAPLFDTERLCRQIESAYREMWRLRARGEAPRPFAVEA